MGDMARTARHSAVKVVVMCATKAMDTVTVNLVGMDFAVTLNAVVDA